MPAILMRVKQLLHSYFSNFRNVSLLLSFSFLLNACSSSEGISNSKTGPANSAIATLSFDAKIFRFTWDDVDEATYYRLLENADGSSGYTQVSGDIPPGVRVFEHSVALFKRFNARYIFQSCNDDGCSDAAPILVDGTLFDAVGDFSGNNVSDSFGYAVSLSLDGSTIAIGASRDRSNSSGAIDGTTDDSGAVYVFTRVGNGWSEQAYLKAASNNIGAYDNFGYSVSLSADGNTLAVGVPFEDSNSGGIDSIVNDDGAANDSGAVYIFVRNGTNWSQQSYLKPVLLLTNPDDEFGSSVSISADGNTLAVGVPGDENDRSGILDFPLTTIGTTQLVNSGAVYTFRRGNSGWSYQSYFKALYPDADDQFGYALSLSADGRTLAVGAIGEDSSSTEVGGDQNNDDGQSNGSGAVFVFNRTDVKWLQQEYIKPHNTDAGDAFGSSVSLSSDGNALAVGAYLEDGNSTGGIFFPLTNHPENDSGAVYVYVRSGNWSQQGYLKADDTGVADYFGRSVSLNAEGTLLAVGAYTEDSNSAGVNSIPDDDGSADSSGAAYTFANVGGVWSQETYLKPKIPARFGFFGRSVSISADSEILVVGAPGQSMLSFY